MVRVVACEARGPGFNSSSDEMVFFSLIGYKEEGKNGAPDMIDCVILCTIVDKKDNS